MGREGGGRGWGFNLSKNSPSLTFFLGPYLQHVDVPRLGMELELQLPAYATATAMPNQATSVTYTAA